MREPPLQAGRRAPMVRKEREDVIPPVFLAPDRFVTVAVYASISGYSDKAIRRKIEDGVWIEKREWIKAPDDRIFIDREGVQRWLTRGG